RNPHRSVRWYHGCLIHRGRIVILTYEQYPCTLEESIKKISYHLNVDLGFDRSKAEAEHLHSLGLAHNEIKLSNVMVDAGNT
ncbi:hypothetical protein K505DRAFT_257598, partial [Melanomma pulvis-pyrius CBS 109.77]